MATPRAWVAALALSCAVVVLLRSAPADAGAPAAAAVSTGAAKPKCEPGAKNDKACRMGAAHDPENLEEEGGLSSDLVAKAPSAVIAEAPDDGNGDDYNDPDKPNDDALIVVGH